MREQHDLFLLENPMNMCEQRTLTRTRLTDDATPPFGARIEQVTLNILNQFDAADEVTCPVIENPK